ncbi:VOC family protein [Vibrio sp. JC009]|uniref:VOC family protein n=1 Tax=Vibrio sp. JC009 TaxID=2912314 RepID=UPI0023AFC7F6|nr:VOC family protein [Vibrio sp. JC009]WED20915.1 VOC family protein [Vibrio sp. JC009]
MKDVLLGAGLLPEQMLDGLDGFSQKIAELADEIGLCVEDFTPDHIALRINDKVVAQAAHRAWASYGDEISSAMINGRPIIVICFDKPPVMFGKEVECLELPYPAEGKSYPQEGWEHVEFIIPSQATTADEYLNDLKERFPQLAENWSQLSGKGIKTKLSSPKGEGERLANPTVAFKKGGVCIKLHPWSLKQVVESERE